MKQKELYGRKRTVDSRSIPALVQQTPFLPVMVQSGANMLVIFTERGFF
jgi:hypothetical protein